MKNKILLKLRTCLQVGRDGVVEIDTDNYRVGMASLELGAGRKTKEDIIDPTAGIIFNVKIGDGLKNDSVIAYLYSSSLSKIRKAEQILKRAIDISKSKVLKSKLIKKIIH